MSGTKAGGKKAAKTNLARYGADFYKINGAKGGRNGHTGGFASNRELARIAGAKGGRISRRGPAKNKKSLAERRLDERLRETEPHFKLNYIEIESKKKGLFKRLFGRKNG